MDSKYMPLSLYGWRPSWIWPKKRVKGVEKFEPYDFLVIWSLMMQYPPLTQFGQTNLAKLHLSLYYYVDVLSEMISVVIEYSLTVRILHYTWMKSQAVSGFSPIATISMQILTFWRILPWLDYAFGKEWWLFEVRWEYIPVTYALTIRRMLTRTNIHT